MAKAGPIRKADSMAGWSSRTIGGIVDGKTAACHRSKEISQGRRTSLAGCNSSAETGVVSESDSASLLITTKGQVPIVIGHWFHEKRTLAISICSCSTGLSTLGIPTLLTALVEQYGLRVAFLAEAAGILVLTILSYLLVRSDPESVGATAYGKNTQQQNQRVSSGRALSNRNYVVLLPMLLLMGAVMSVGYSHLAVRISANGFDSYTVANAVMISGLMLTVGKLAYG